MILQQKSHILHKKHSETWPGSQDLQEHSPTEDVVCAVQLIWLKALNYTWRSPSTSVSLTS